MANLNTPPSMTYDAHTDRVWSLNISAGTLVTGGGDSVVRIWNAASGACTNFVTANTGAAVVACQRHDNTVYYASSVQAYSYNIQSGALAEESVPTSVAPLALCFDCAPPLIYIGYSDNVIRVWKNGECKGRYKGHTGEVRCLQLAGHAMFTGAEDQQIIRWNTNTAKATVLFKGTAGPIRDLVVDGDDLWFANGNNVRCQSISTGQMRHNLPGHTDVVVCIALYQKRSVVLSGGADSVIVCHSTQSGEMLFSLTPPQPTIVKSIKIDAGFLFAAVGNLVYAWDLEPLVSECAGPGAAVTGPGGRPMQSFHDQQPPPMGPGMGTAAAAAPIMPTMPAFGEQPAGGFGGPPPGSATSNLPVLGATQPPPGGPPFQEEADQQYGALSLVPEGDPNGFGGSLNGGGGGGGVAFNAYDEVAGGDMEGYPPLNIGADESGAFPAPITGDGFAQEFDNAPVPPPPPPPPR